MAFTDAYIQKAKEILDRPSVFVRGSEIKEIINTSIELTDPSDVLLNFESRKTPMRYLAGELALYFSRCLEYNAFLYYSKSWQNSFCKKAKYVYDEEFECINSAYGNLIFNPIKDEQVSQYNWTKQSLLDDMFSRQAVMHFNRPAHQYSENKDFPCTMYTQYLIRENQLNAITYMRSNDLYFGTTFDIPFFVILAQYLLEDLKTVDSKFSSINKINYIHNATSLHIYSDKFEQFQTLIDDYDNGRFEIVKLPHFDNLAFEETSTYCSLEKAIRTNSRINLGHYLTSEFWKTFSTRLAVKA